MEKISPWRNAQREILKICLTERKRVNLSTSFFSYSAVTRIFLVPFIVMARKSWNLFSPSAIANYFRRTDFVTPSTHFEEVVESESVSSFENDFDVECTFEEYI